MSFQDYGFKQNRQRFVRRMPDRAVPRRSVCYMLAPGALAALWLGGAFIFDLIIAVDTANFNLKTAAIAAGWDQVQPLQARVTINAGVYVYSTSTGTYAFDTGTSFPAGSELSLINNGFIVGKSGAGGNGATGSAIPADATPGGNGGPALHVQALISITNASGIIGGGGGGGGGGEGRVDDALFTWGAGGGGGGGGQGDQFGGGGNGGGTTYPGSAGGNGSKTAAGGEGAGGSGSGGVAGNGGVGGTLGVDGAIGHLSSGAGGISGNRSNGGTAGHAIDGNANINWISGNDPGTKILGIIT